jgi:hypothetical protein
MKTSQPQLPTMPRDWREPVECRGSELAAVIAEALAAGYHAHRMTAADVAVYRLQFWRITGTADAGKKSGNPTKTGIEARKSCVPDSFYASTFHK